MDLAGAAGKFRDTAYEATGGETEPEGGKINFYTEPGFKGKRVAYFPPGRPMPIGSGARSVHNLTATTIRVWEGQEGDVEGSHQFIESDQSVDNIHDKEGISFEAQSFESA